MRKKSWCEQDLISSVKNSTSIRQVIKSLGLIPAGGNYVQVQHSIKELNLNTAHFTGKGWSKGMTGRFMPAIPLADILKKGTTYQSFKLKRRLFIEKIIEKKCCMCGWNKMSLDGRIPLELDHINGDRYDNRLENLRVLCPNCHSLQPTHRGRNKKK